MIIKVDIEPELARKIIDAAEILETNSGDPWRRSPLIKSLNDLILEALTPLVVDKARKVLAGAVKLPR